MIKNTKDLIKILPLDKEFKKDLLESYDSLKSENKFNIQRILWDMYDGIFDFKLQENLGIALSEAKQNREKLDKNFFTRIRDLTQNEMGQVTEDDIRAMDLEMTRDKLADIVAETKPQV